MSTVAGSVPGALTTLLASSGQTAMTADNHPTRAEARDRVSRATQVRDSASAILASVLDWKTDEALVQDLLRLDGFIVQLEAT